MLSFFLFRVQNVPKLFPAPFEKELQTYIQSIEMVDMELVGL